MVQQLQHAEGAFISRGQRRQVSILPDKHVGRKEKAVRKLRGQAVLWHVVAAVAHQ